MLTGQIQEVLMQEVVIDVSELAPPEPMTAILMALAKLKAQHYLKVLHRREPFPLYPKLVAAGWNYHCQPVVNDDSDKNSLDNSSKGESEITQFQLYIYRQTEQASFELLAEKLALT